MASRRPDIFVAGSAPKDGSAKALRVSPAARPSPRLARPGSGVSAPTARHTEQTHRDLAQPQEPRGTRAETPQSAALPGPRLLDVRETARYLGVSVRTVHTWRASGALQPVKLPTHKLLFDLCDLDAFIEAHK